MSCIFEPSQIIGFFLRSGVKVLCIYAIKFYIFIHSIFLMIKSSPLFKMVELRPEANNKLMRKAKYIDMTEVRSCSGSSVNFYFILFYLRFVYWVFCLI